MPGRLVDGNNSAQGSKPDGGVRLASFYSICISQTFEYRSTSRTTTTTT